MQEVAENYLVSEGIIMNGMNALRGTHIVH